MARIFISYAHAVLDEEASNWLAASLADGGAQAWHDVKCLRFLSGEGINTEIAQAIRQADLIIAVISSNSLASPYCRSELVFAMECGKAVLRLDLEEIHSLPDVLLPLLGHAVKGPELHRVPKAEWSYTLAHALSECGIALRTSNVDPMDFSANARVIRPNYRDLRQGDEHSFRRFVRRLKEAEALNPRNGFTSLNLAFLWLYQRDAQAALQAARAAIAQLPDEPNGHYALALALCIAAPVATRSLHETKSILQPLARARQLHPAYAHVDLLSAIVIANHYLPIYADPPKPPEVILGWGTRADREFDPDECQRVLDLEPLHLTPQTRYLEAELLPYRKRKQ